MRLRVFAGLVVGLFLILTLILTGKIGWDSPAAYAQPSAPRRPTIERPATLQRPAARKQDKRTASEAQQQLTPPQSSEFPAQLAEALLQNPALWAEGQRGFQGGSGLMGGLSPNGRFQISAWANEIYAGYFVLDTQTGKVVRSGKKKIDNIPNLEVEKVK